MLWVLLGLVVVVSGSKWSCAPVSRVAVQAGVEYRAWNCTGAPASGEGSWAVGPLLFHVVSSDLTLRRPVPGVAPHGLATLPEFVPPTAAAAINGGFFWEINKKHFLDDVCFFKTRADALQPPSAAHPNYGLGDTLVIRDGVLLSSNCGERATCPCHCPLHPHVQISPASIDRRPSSSTALSRPC